MGHTKNVAAFEKLLGYCTGYGGSYQPVRQNLQVSTMNALLAQARQTMRGVTVARNHYNAVTNEREIAFGNLSQLTASIFYALAAIGTDDQTLNDARFFLRKIQGRTKYRDPIPSGEAEETETPAPRRRSGYSSYTSRTSNFGKLVEMVSALPAYQPNEKSLQVESLQARVEELRALNQKVIEARVNWSNALIERDQVLYTRDIALHPTAIRAKRYLRSVFGPNSAEYARVKNIILTKS